MIRTTTILLLVAAIAAGTGALAAQDLNSSLRGPTPLNDEGPAAPIPQMRNGAEKEMRNYPEQPPVIPHSIDGYQIDLNSNKCLSCHARARTAQSQAPMVSITHFMDRDGQFLASVSPRRFFCTECHVPQATVSPPVSNDFVDIDTMLSRAGAEWTPMITIDKPAPRPGFLKRTWDFALELLDVLIRPSSVFALGALVLAGFVAGVVFWGGFNTALELTNTEKFCTSCHEMRDNVFAELKSTIHFSNRSGVRASCPDCHVPHNWTDKIARKMQASKEVWGHLFGFIDTRDKFVDKRLELALHEWARFKANDSLECRNCHSAGSMDITKQSPRASDAHQRFLFTGEKTCIDCHKGIAHRLPDMRGVPGWQ
jgi:cytochrome c-type protein NapC